VKDDKDEAMAVSPSSSKWKGGKGGKKQCGECWNCSSKEHFKDKCPEPTKSSHRPKEAAKPNTKAASGSTNVVVQDVDSESDGVWVAIETNGKSVTSYGSMPDLQAVTDLSASDISYVESFVEDDSYWFSEVAEDTDEFDDDKWSFEDYPLETSPTPDFSGEALVATELAKPDQYAYIKAELYDSGCMQHISPF